MQPVLAEDPDYYWGWLNQAEWASEVATPAEYLETAEALARLDDDDPVAAGYLGDARLRTGDRDGARAAFRRAFKRSPGHAYTALSLFDLELEDRRLDSAAEVLASLKEHHDGAFTLAREVQLAGARNDRAAAVAALERLCVTAIPGNDWPPDEADRCFTKAGWGRYAVAVYERALDLPEVVSRVGALWIQRCARSGDWRCARRLGSLLKRGEIGVVALDAYLNALAMTRSSWRLRWCMRRHGAAIRANTRCWGMLGFALTCVVRHAEAARWLADWRDRGDAQPWMLINLVLALRAIRRVDEANRVSRRALELPADGTVPHHRIWLALDNLIDGDGQEAHRWLDGLDSKNYDATNRYLLELARLLIHRVHAAPAERRAVLRATWRRLWALSRETGVSMEDHGAVVRTYRRVTRRMSADHGPVFGFLGRVACRFVTPRVAR